MLGEIEAEGWDLKGLANEEARHAYSLTREFWTRQSEYAKYVLLYILDVCLYCICDIYLVVCVCVHMMYAYIIGQV